MYDTILEATHAWVREMHHIPFSVVEKLREANYEDLMEITPPAKYDRVTVYDDEWRNQEGEIVGANYDGEPDLYLVKLDSDPDDPKVICQQDMEVHRDDGLPMWGTMFAFTDTIDNEWLKDNLQAMADCGFRVYESEDYDYVFGIDGAGYDFYEAHWIPLYKARGLHWHKQIT